MRCGEGLAFVLTMSLASLARAQPPGPPPITTNDYDLEISQGPITTATRIIGVGGAFAALAEWCEGEYVNAASPAVRAPYSLEAFDYDVCFGMMSPGWFGWTDFENRSRANRPVSAGSRFKGALNVNAGVQLQFGNFGITVDYDAMTFGVDAVSLGAITRTRAYDFRIDRVTGSAAWALFNEQFVLGAGLRSVLAGASAGRTTTGAGYQVGAIYKPNLKPFRIGITYRDPVRISNIGGDPSERRADGTQVADGRVVPASIVMPLELEAGIAFEGGPRLLNPDWISPDAFDVPLRQAIERERVLRTASLEERVEQAPKGQRELLRRALVEEERKRAEDEDAQLKRAHAANVEALKKRAKLWPRHGITLLASLLVVGRTPNAVGISGFVAQERDSYGDSTTVSPRFGFETEPIPYWLTVRGGTYLEPSRYEDGLARVHVTAGADVAIAPFRAWGLFNDNPWRIRLALDGAPHFTNVAIAIGQYH